MRQSGVLSSQVAGRMQDPSSFPGTTVQPLLYRGGIDSFESVLSDQMHNAGRLLGIPIFLPRIVSVLFRLVCHYTSVLAHANKNIAATSTVMAHPIIHR